MTKQRKKSHYHLLREKWTERHRGLQENLWGKHKDAMEWISNHPKQLMAGSLGGLVLLTNPVIPSAISQTPVFEDKLAQDLDRRVFMIHDLTKLVPQEVRPLTLQEEEDIAIILSRDFGFRVAAELDGKRLNRSYGYIGAEQHLMRYPGDTMETHFQTSEESGKYYSSGMAPGRGAWGYFTQGELTQQDIEREKYYIAVQTFLSPGFRENVAEHYAFYKYRKMLVVNPENGKAVVVVIGDAGPAEWTGKSLGGSPEVMKHLERVDGRAKGPVLYFFIDDPEDKIPLGPVEV